MEGRSFFPSFFVSQPPPLARPPSSPLVRERAASAATWCERSARGLTTTKSRISRRERGESLFALLRSRPPRRLGPRPPFLSSSRPQSPLFSISLDFFLRAGAAREAESGRERGRECERRTRERDLTRRRRGDAAFAVLELILFLFLLFGCEPFF